MNRYARLRAARPATATHRPASRGTANQSTEPSFLGPARPRLAGRCSASHASTRHGNASLGPARLRNARRSTSGQGAASQSKEPQFHATRRYAQPGYVGPRNDRRGTACQGTATQAQAARGIALPSKELSIHCSASSRSAGRGYAERCLAGRGYAWRGGAFLSTDTSIPGSAAQAVASHRNARRGGARRTTAGHGPALQSNEPLIFARGQAPRSLVRRRQARPRRALHAFPRNLSSTPGRAFPRKPWQGDAEHAVASQCVAQLGSAAPAIAPLGSAPNTKPRNP